MVYMLRSATRQPLFLFNSVVMLWLHRIRSMKHWRNQQLTSRNSCRNMIQKTHHHNGYNEEVTWSMWFYTWTALFQATGVLKIQRSWSTWWRLDIPMLSTSSLKASIALNVRSLEHRHNSGAKWWWPFEEIDRGEATVAEMNAKSSTFILDFMIQNRGRVKLLFIKWFSVTPSIEMKSLSDPGWISTGSTEWRRVTLLGTPTHQTVECSFDFRNKDQWRRS